MLTMSSCIPLRYTCEPASPGLAPSALGSCQHPDSAHFLPRLPTQMLTRAGRVIACQGTIGRQPLPAHRVRRNFGKETHLLVGEVTTPLSSALQELLDPLSVPGLSLSLSFSCLYHLSWLPPRLPSEKGIPLGISGSAAESGVSWEPRSLLSFACVSLVCPGPEQSP